MNKKAVYAGTFDPFTLGHLNIAERSANLFDEVIIGVADNERKKPLFSFKKRCEMASSAVGHLNNVRVMEVTGLTVHFAKEQGAHYLIRGVRSAVDYDYESSIAGINEELSAGAVETVIMLAAPRFSHVSSSIIRELIEHQAVDAVEHYLPVAVFNQII